MRKNHIIAWGIALIDLLAVVACGVLYALNRGSGLAFLNTLAFSLLPLSGAVIIAKQPRNPVGWLPVILGFIFTTSDLCTQYATYALVTNPGQLPLGGAASWFQAWSWMLIYPFVVAFVLLIPNGKLLSRRWELLVWISAITSLPMILWMISFIAPMNRIFLLNSQAPQSNNPPPTPGAGLQVWQLMQPWLLLQFLLILLAAVGLFVRFRRSRGVERQQLKWIFLAVTTIPVSVLLGYLSGQTVNPLLNNIYLVVNLVSACSFPVALAISVTRYRLYEIDFIIRRTLVYSSLTVILALIYLGSVFLLEAIFTRLVGQSSTASIGISTLLIAALFSPLRRRIQTWIDRRFYRSRYDTEQILARLAALQRETVDLDQYIQQLLGLVEETLHPEFVSLYLVNRQESRKSAHSPHK